MGDFFDDLQRRDERRRTATINGKEYIAQCTDPYGLWHIVDCEVDQLDGTYTSIESLWQAVNSYEAAEALLKGTKAPTPITKDTIIHEDAKPNKAKSKRVPISDLKLEL